MMISFAYGRLVVEFVKRSNHFVLIYPNTPTGRMAAKGAVRDWLLDYELDFDRNDAEMFRKAIDMNRFHVMLDRSSKRDLPRGMRRP